MDPQCKCLHIYGCSSPISNCRAWVARQPGGQYAIPELIDNSLSIHASFNGEALMGKCHIYDLCHVLCTPHVCAYRSLLGIYMHVDCIITEATHDQVQLDKTLYLHVIGPGYILMYLAQHTYTVHTIKRVLIKLIDKLMAASLLLLSVYALKCNVLIKMLECISHRSVHKETSACAEAMHAMTLNKETRVHGSNVISHVLPPPMHEDS